MIIALILIGGFFFVEARAPSVTASIGWLPLLSLMVFIIGFSVRYGTAALANDG